MPTAALLSLDGHLDEATALQLLTQLKVLPSEVEDLAAAVLRIRIGGGSLGAAQAVAEGLDTLRTELGIPIVGLVIETALSAGFFAALACDHVVASPAASLGGCGAIVRRLSIDRLLARIGVSYQPITSGLLKDNLFPLNALEAQQEEDLKGLVSDHLAQFMSFVRIRRAVDTAVLDQISEGQIFSGIKALDLGLIDENGAMFAALTAAGRLSSVDTLRVQAVSSDSSNSAESSLIEGITSFLTR